MHYYRLGRWSLEILQRTFSPSGLHLLSQWGTKIVTKICLFGPAMSICSYNCAYVIKNSPNVTLLLAKQRVTQLFGGSHMSHWPKSWSERYSQVKNNIFERGQIFSLFTTPKPNLVGWRSKFLQGPQKYANLFCSPYKWPTGSHLVTCETYSECILLEFEWGTV